MKWLSLSASPSRIRILAIINITLTSISLVSAFSKALPLVFLIGLEIGWLLLLVNFKNSPFRLASWLSQTTFPRWKIWLAALVVFEGFILLGQSISEGVLGTAAFINTAAVLLWMNRPPEPIYKPLPRWATAGLCLILIMVALLTSLWQFDFIRPLAHNLGDSWLYYQTAQNLLGNTTEPGHTLVFPSLIVLTGFIHNNLISLVIFQHLLRGLIAVLAFLIFKKHHVGFAILAAGLLAVSPVSAHFAHMMMTESIYLSLLALAALFAVASVKNPIFLVVTGLVCALLAFTRGVGIVIIGILLVYIFFSTFSLKKSAVLLISFVVSYGILFFVQGHFLKEKADVAYYYFPLLYYDLLDEDNGPIARQYIQEVVNSETCPYEIPEHPSQLGQTVWPIDFWVCARMAYAKPGIEKDLYAEGIRAQPIRYFKEVWQQVFRFITLSEVPSVYRELDSANYPLIYTLGRPMENPCDLEDDYYREYLDYICAGNQPTQVDQRLLKWGKFYTDVLMQPYRLQGDELWVRFWTALTMITFILITSPRLRLLTLLFVVIIIYHAGIVAFAQWNVPRYVLVLDPLFVMITAAFLASVLEPLTDRFRKPDEKAAAEG